MKRQERLIAPRKLHNTQVLCPAEAPEGGSVGIVKNCYVNNITNMTNLFLFIIIENRANKI